MFQKQWKFANMIGTVQPRSQELKESEPFLKILGKFSEMFGKLCPNTLTSVTVQTVFEEMVYKFCGKSSEICGSVRKSRSSENLRT